MSIRASIRNLSEIKQMYKQQNQFMGTETLNISMQLNHISKMLEDTVMKFTRRYLIVQTELDEMKQEFMGQSSLINEYLTLAKKEITYEKFDKYQQGKPLINVPSVPFYEKKCLIRPNTKQRCINSNSNNSVLKSNSKTITNPQNPISLNNMSNNNLNNTNINNYQSTNKKKIYKSDFVGEGNIKSSLCDSAQYRSSNGKSKYNKIAKPNVNSSNELLNNCGDNNGCEHTVKKNNNNYHNKNSLSAFNCRSGKENKNLINKKNIDKDYSNNNLNDINNYNEMNNINEFNSLNEENNYNICYNNYLNNSNNITNENDNSKSCKKNTITNEDDCNCKNDLNEITRSLFQNENLINKMETNSKENVIYKAYNLYRKNKQIKITEKFSNQELQAYHNDITNLIDDSKIKAFYILINNNMLNPNEKLKLAYMNKEILSYVLPTNILKESKKFYENKIIYIKSLLSNFSINENDLIFINKLASFPSKNAETGLNYLAKEREQELINQNNKLNYALIKMIFICLNLKFDIDIQNNKVSVKQIYDKLFKSFAVNSIKELFTDVIYRKIYYELICDDQLYNIDNVIKGIESYKELIVDTLTNNTNKTFSYAAFSIEDVGDFLKIYSEIDNMNNKDNIKMYFKLLMEIKKYKLLMKDISER